MKRNLGCVYRIGMRFIFGFSSRNVTFKGVHECLAFRI